MFASHLSGHQLMMQRNDLEPLVRDRPSTELHRQPLEGTVALGMRYNVGRCRVGCALRRGSSCPRRRITWMSWLCMCCMTGRRSFRPAA